MQQKSFEEKLKGLEIQISKQVEQFEQENECLLLFQRPLPTHNEFIKLQPIPKFEFLVIKKTDISYQF